MAEVGLRHGVGAPAVGIGLDHLSIGEDEERQQQHDDARDRLDRPQGARPRRGEDHQHRLGPVRDRGQGVEREGCQTLEGRDLLARLVAAAPCGAKMWPQVAHLSPDLLPPWAPPAQSSAGISAFAGGWCGSVRTIWRTSPGGKAGTSPCDAAPQAPQAPTAGARTAVGDALCGRRRAHEHHVARREGDRHDEAGLEGLRIIAGRHPTGRVAGSASGRQPELGVTAVDDRVAVHGVARRGRVVGAEPVGAKRRLSLTIGADVHASAVSGPVAGEGAQPREGARRGRHRRSGRRDARRRRRRGRRFGDRWEGGGGNAARAPGRRNDNAPGCGRHDGAGHGRQGAALCPPSGRPRVHAEARRPEHEQRGDDGRRPRVPTPSSPFAWLLARRRRRRGPQRWPQGPPGAAPAALSPPAGGLGGRQQHHTPGRRRDRAGPGARRGSGRARPIRIGRRTDRRRAPRGRSHTVPTRVEPPSPQPAQRTDPGGDGGGVLAAVGRRVDAPTVVRFHIASKVAGWAAGAPPTFDLMWNRTKDRRARSLRGRTCGLDRPAAHGQRSTAVAAGITREPPTSTMKLGLRRPELNRSERPCSSTISSRTEPARALPRRRCPSVARRSPSAPCPNGWHRSPQSWRR